MRAKLVGVVIIVMVVALGVMGFRLRRAQLALQDAALRADSTEAANDRQRTLLVRGLEVQARRIIQMTLERDSLDRDLRVESRLRVAAQIQVARLLATTTATTEEDTTGTRRASFNVRQEPYTAHADVALPRPPTPGTLALQVSLDTIGMHARVVCGTAVAGVRPATLLVDGPPWAAFRLEQLEQDPAVCNAPKGLPPPRRWLDRPLQYVGAIGVVGAVAYIVGRIF